MDDLISRKQAIDAVKRNTFRLTFAEEQNCEGHVAWSAEAVYSDVMEGELLELPSAQLPDIHVGDMISRQQAVELIERMKPYHQDADDIAEMIDNMPSAQPKTGRWINKGVFYGDDIEEWQECQCSECGRWDTRPYMYYFSEPNYCSYCGAKRKRGEQDDSV